MHDPTMPTGDLGAKDSNVEVRVDKGNPFDQKPLKEHNAARLEELFKSGDIQKFFDEGLDFVIDDLEGFSAEYSKFLKGNVTREKFPQGLPAELDVLARIRIASLREGVSAQERSDLLAQVEEVKEVFDMLKKREGQVRVKGGSLVEELSVESQKRKITSAIQRHGTSEADSSEFDLHEPPKPLALSEQSALIEKFNQRILHDEKSNNKLSAYHHFVRDGRPMPNSFDSHGLAKGVKEQQIVNSAKLDTEEGSGRKERMIKEKVQEIIEFSNDPIKIDAANQRNLNSADVCELGEGDFLQGAPLTTMEKVRNVGFLCREVTGARDMGSSNYGGTVSFSRQREDPNLEAPGKHHRGFSNIWLRTYFKKKFVGRYMGDAAIFSGYGAHEDDLLRRIANYKPQESHDTRKQKIGTNSAELRIAHDTKINDDAITYILKEQKGAYKMNLNVDSDYSDEYGVGLGVPSTEIKGIVVNATHEKNLKDALAEVMKFPFFVPVYDAATGVLVNGEMKKMYQTKEA